MAIAFRGLTGVSVNGTTLTAAAPAGTVVGDVMLGIGISSEFSSTDGLDLTTVGAAPTVLYNAQGSSGGDYSSDFDVVGKVVDSVGNLTLTRPSAGFMIGAQLTYSGVDPTTPFEVKSASLATGLLTAGVGGDLVIPAIETLTAGDVVLAVLAFPTYLGGYSIFPDGWDGLTTTPGWTKRAGGTYAGESYAPSLGIYEKTMGAPGSTGAFTLTIPAGNPPNTVPWFGALIALKPNAAAPPPAVPVLRILAPGF